MLTAKVANSARKYQAENTWKRPSASKTVAQPPNFCLGPASNHCW
ncbi:hypothetical protein SAMN06266982_11297 [Propioniciclava tarda]|nr:hypothetical protein SAMN06266982_11297 [Propioniciclava tarda]